jgi:tetratricopeptide (TPR) repeat protein
MCRKLGVIASRSLFERVIDKAPLAYRARAMVSLGTTFVQTGDLHSARELYNDALRASRNNWSDSEAIVLSHKMSAVAKSIDGDHRGALEKLERFLPLARIVGTASPQILCDYLNGCAVELAEAGRIEEARNISNIVLASPYAFAYPEWRETSDDIALREYRLSRSVVSFALKTKPLNVLHLPERIYDTDKYSPNPFQTQASVVSLEKWKSKMVKEPNGANDNDENLDEMDEKDLIVKLLQLTAYEGVDEKKLRKVVEYAKQVMSEPGKK